MSPSNSNYSRCAIYLLSCIISIPHHHIHATLTLDDADTWSDDFTEDQTGENGWSIQKRSGYDLPDGFTNPLVTISDIPSYHGPFPASYTMQRSITCNTIGDTRLYVSMLASYCNTDKKDDCIQFNITDASSDTSTSPLPTFLPFKLNHNDKPLDTNDLPFVQDTTAYYYTNHSSSTTIIPQCSDTTAYDTTTTTTAATSYLIPGRWYTYNKHQTYDLAVTGGNPYDISIEMQMSGDPDEYVIISHIYAVCFQLNPTVNPIETTSEPSTSTGTMFPPSYHAITPTTEKPTNTPSETITTTMITDTTHVLSTTDTNVIYTTDVESTNIISYTETLSTSIATDVGSTDIEVTTDIITDYGKGEQIATSQDEIWCQHCAIYVLLGCVVLVICFMILMCVACVMYKKEENKKNKRRSQREKSVNNPGNEQAQAQVQMPVVTVVDIDTEERTSSSDDHNDTSGIGDLDIATLSDHSPNIDRADVMSDMNIITYDSMTEREANHPAHKMTISIRKEDGSRESKDASESDDTTWAKMNGAEGGDSKEDPHSDDSEYEKGIDGMSDGEDETNPIFNVDDASYDHMNMSEDGIIDDSESRYD